MNRIAIAAALAVSLGACSTMNVTLEKGESGKASVSAVATAPTGAQMEALIARTNRAMVLACTNRKAEVQQRTGEALIDDANQTIGDATKLAEGVKELLDAVRSWFPENTYTAARICE